MAYLVNVEMWFDPWFVCQVVTFVASIWTPFSAVAVCALVVTFSAACWPRKLAASF